MSRCSARLAGAGPACALLLAVLVAACGGRPSATKEAVVAHTTEPAATRRVEVALPFVGTTDSGRRVELRAATAGRVVAVAVADGAAVAPGAAVFRLGGPSLAARREAVATEVRTATEGAAAAQDRLTRAERRAEEHLAAPAETSEARQTLATARAREADARARRDSLAAATTIRAPFAGRFDERRVAAGQEVVADEVLGAVVDASGIRVRATLMAGSDGPVREGERAVVEGPGGGELAARVSGLEPAAGAGGQLRVWLAGEDLGELAPGVAVRGRIVTAVHERAVVVPPAAIVRDERDRAFVFVGEKPPYARRSVAVGEEGPDWVEIVRGLAAGEPVVVEGAYELYWTEFGKRFRVPD